MKPWLLLWCCIAWSGCGGPAQPPAPAPEAPPARGASNVPAASAVPADSEPVFHLATAQVNLPRVKLWIGAREIVSEVCVSVPQIATGLMHRRSIGPEETMLFVFGSARERSFYMKNVPFDIDVAYIDPDGVIQEIVRLKANDAKGVPSRSSRIQFVLEAAPDYFTRNGFGPGTLIATDRGDLARTLGPMAQLQ
ncbi:MAG: DUF192 domain-containing protein [Verrucomicrobiota bacterium]